MTIQCMWQTLAVSNIIAFTDILSTQGFQVILEERCGWLDLLCYFFSCGTNSEGQLLDITLAAGLAGKKTLSGSPF